MVNVILILVFRRKILFTVVSGFLPILALYVHIPRGNKNCTCPASHTYRSTGTPYRPNIPYIPAYMIVSNTTTGLSNDPNYYR